MLDFNNSKSRIEIIDQEIGRRFVTRPRYEPSQSNCRIDTVVLEEMSGKSRITICT